MRLSKTKLEIHSTSRAHTDRGGEEQERDMGRGRVVKIF